MAPPHPPSPLPSPPIPTGTSPAWRMTPPAGEHGPSPTSSAPSTMCPASSASALPRHTRDTSQVSGTHMPRMPVVGQEGNIPRAASASPRHTRDTSQVSGAPLRSLMWQSAGRGSNISAACSSPLYPFPQRGKHSLHPLLLSCAPLSADRLVRACAELPKMCEYFHIPFQVNGVGGLGEELRRIP